MQIEEATKSGFAYNYRFIELTIDRDVLKLKIASLERTYAALYTRVYTKLTSASFVGVAFQITNLYQAMSHDAMRS